MRKVKAALKIWNGNLQETLIRKEEELLKEIEICDSIAKLSGLNPDALAFCSSLKADLMSIHRVEERNHVQKSKLHWLKEGDENSGFFHRFLAAKRRRNLISELINEQGEATKSFET